MLYDIAIIGGGPAGLTAAIYARRGGRSVVLLEKDGFGGQMATSPRIENFPGFADISGPELADRMASQAMDLGAEVELAEATELHFSDGVWTVLTDTGSLSARAVILAAGVRHRKLGLPGEEELIGAGVSFCAVCDGAFYTNRTALVIGGGNSALQEALLLSATCREVILCHRRDFTAEPMLQDRLFEQPNITAVTGVAPDAFLRDCSGALTGVRFHWVATGEPVDIACDGVFEAIGLLPENGAFSNLGLTEDGYIQAGEDTLTACPGVFAAGDCREKTTRQIATAVADGAVAALAAGRYLDSLGL